MRVPHRRHPAAGRSPCVQSLTCGATWPRWSRSSAPSTRRTCLCGTWPLRWRWPASAPRSCPSRSTPRAPTSWRASSLLIRSWLASRCPSSCGRARCSPWPRTCARVATEATSASAATSPPSSTPTCSATFRRSTPSCGTRARTRFASFARASGTGRRRDRWLGWWCGGQWARCPDRSACCRRSTACPSPTAAASPTTCWASPPRPSSAAAAATRTAPSAAFTHTPRTPADRGIGGAPPRTWSAR